MAAGRTKVTIQLSEQAKQHVRIEVNKRALAEGYLFDEPRIAAEIQADEIKMATVTGRLAHTLISDPRSKRDPDYYQTTRRYLDAGWVDVHAMVGKKGVPFGHFVMMFARQGLDSELLSMVIRALDPSVKANVPPETNGEEHTILWLALKSGSAAKLGLLLNPDNPYPIDLGKSPWAEEMYEVLQRDFRHKPMDADWSPVLNEAKARHLIRAGLIVEPYMREKFSTEALFGNYFKEAEATWDRLQRGMQAQKEGRTPEEGTLTTQMLKPEHIKHLYSVDRLSEALKKEWWEGQAQHASSLLSELPLQVRESAAISIRALEILAQATPPQNRIAGSTVATQDAAQTRQR